MTIPSGKKTHSHVEQQTSDLFKSSSSKATANFSRGADPSYLSTETWRPAYAKPLRQARNRQPVSRSLGEGWLFFFNRSIQKRPRPRFPKEKASTPEKMAS